MTIKELKTELEAEIESEEIKRLEAACKYGEGLHRGHTIGLQKCLYLLTFLEGYNEESND